MSIARVRERGQITLPLAVRVALGASTGSDLLFVPTGPGVFTVQRLPRVELLLDLVEEFADDGPVPDLGAQQSEANAAWDAPFHPGQAESARPESEEAGR